MRFASFFVCLLFLSPVALGSDLVVQLPTAAGAHAITSAVATARMLKLDVQGQIGGATVTFPKVLPDTAYDVRLTLADGTVLQGVDMGWYDEEPAKKDAGEMDKDDREQIRAIVQDVPGFYNKRDILMLRGDHDRAVALLRFIRDKGFVNDKGGEVIWRIELWYFKNQLGGWEAVQQQNKILRRERFGSLEARKSVEDPIRWIPQLGGLRLPKGEASKSVMLAKIPDTQPVEIPSK